MQHQRIAPANINSAVKTCLPSQYNSQKSMRLLMKQKIISQACLNFSDFEQKGGSSSYIRDDRRFLPPFITSQRYASFDQKLFKFCGAAFFKNTYVIN